MLISNINSYFFLELSVYLYIERFKMIILLWTKSFLSLKFTHLILHGSSRSKNTLLHVIKTLRTQYFTVLLVLKIHYFTSLKLYVPNTSRLYFPLLSLPFNVYEEMHYSALLLGHITCSIWVLRSSKFDTVVSILHFNTIQHRHLLARK